MNYRELQNSARIYRPAILLDRLVRRDVRTSLRRILGVCVLLVALDFFGYIVVASIPALADRSGLDELFIAYLPRIEGFFLVLLSLGGFLFAIEAFYNSYYLRDLDPLLPEWRTASSGRSVSFEVASLALAGSSEDLAADFLGSSLGSLVSLRADIPEHAVRRFLAGGDARTPIRADRFSIPDDPRNAPVALGDYVSALLAQDGAFSRFVGESGRTADEVSGAALWVERILRAERRRRRWWGKDRLGRVPGIGKDWALGGAFELARYAREISEEQNYAALSAGLLYGKEVESLEGVLARTREANAIVVGDDGAALLSIPARLYEMIRGGSVLPPLEGKRVFVLDGNSFIAKTETKAAFESELLRVVNDAIEAGNIILVLPDFASFVEDARSLGSDLPALLDPYLESPALQVVALSGKGEYHAVIEPDMRLAKRFERIMVGGAAEDALLAFLEDEAVLLEDAEAIFFTYPALLSMARSAARYFAEGGAAEKALDLLSEIPALIKREKRRSVRREDVLRLVEGKTGIAVGEVREDERQKLLSLEETLGKRIVGQREAIHSISAALMRARSGIGNPNRPLGSFLFLGPTGVGKTETTKALAAAFFGDERSTARLDMSEYQTVDAMERLIGSFESGKPGVLSSLLRTKPYGVLLLDEFEKASKDIRDLFLQVLDEGFFSDMSGKRVNARNLLIVATSNAGSDLIWNAIRGGANDLAPHRDRILNDIINRGTFTPELLNRFDGVILFRPLSSDDLRRIARLELAKLERRLAEKGITLVVGTDLIEALVRLGSDPKFGARPIGRAIQDTVEARIAEKMLRREVSTGGTVELTAEELSAMPQAAGREPRGI